MCVNESKTEVMWIGNKNIKHPGITVGNNLVPFQNQIKALGVTISHDLSWELHASNVISKGKKLLSALYHTRKYLTESQFLRSVANNFSSTVFYASTVWFDNLKKSTQRKFNTLYHRMLRIATKDYYRTLTNRELTSRCKRASPREWVKYSTCTKVVKIIRENAPVCLVKRLNTNRYIESRRSGRNLFFDRSKTKIGKQSLENRLQIFNNIHDNWTHPALTNDQIRIMMKKTFFSYMK